MAVRVGRLAMQKRTMTTGKKKVGQRAAWACAAWHLHANLHCVQGSSGTPRRSDDGCVGAGADEQG